VQFRLLPSLLKQEGSDFYRIDRRWQPKDLIPTYYSRNLLDEVEGRYRLLDAAEDEFQKLDRADKYIRILKRVRLTIKRAKFSWRSDNLIFLQSIAEFYQDYGTILQMLKTDQSRGRLEPEE
jgi:hypothetical protein